MRCNMRLVRILCVTAIFLVLALPCMAADGSAGASPSQGAPTHFMREPDIYGTHVVFTSEGDLWLGDMTTGKAIRITRDEGTESNAHFSPDGTQIAYTADYFGIREIYVIPAEGGVPKRVSFMDNHAEVVDWAPDGKSIMVRAPGNPAWWTLWSVSLAGGYPTRLPLEFASHACYAPDGNRFVFTRFSRADATWFRYQGGEKNDIWIGDLAAKKFKKTFESQFTNEYPMWAGDKVYFINESMEGFRVLGMNPDGGKTTTITGPSSVEIRFLNTDGKQLIYERGIGIEVADLATGKTKPIDFTMTSDLQHTLPYISAADRFVMSAHCGPTGKRVMFETRGQILSVPVTKGEVRLILAKDGVRYRLPCYSPDGERMAYISDETREQELYICKLDGSEPKQLTSDAKRQLVGISWSPNAKMIALVENTGKIRLIDVETGNETPLVTEGAPYFCFSPDSKWIAYEDPDRFSGVNYIALYNIAEQKRYRFGKGMTNDYRPVFSTDGKWIVFISNRSINIEGDDIQNVAGVHNTRNVYLLALSKDTKSPWQLEDDEESPARDDLKKKEEPKPDGEAKPDEPKKEEPKKEEPKKPTEEIKIDLDGLYDRQIQIPIGGSGYGDLYMVGDRILIMDGNSLNYYDLKEKKYGSVATGVEWMQLTDDWKHIMLYGGANNTRVIDVNAKDVGGGGDKATLAGFMLHINPVREWENMYWDAWRLQRDYFYVANMHGNDWPMIGEKYAKMLPAVHSRDELNEILRWLQCELTVGHAWVYGGDTRGLYRGVSPAYLGVDLELDPSGYFKIARVLRNDGFAGSPESPFAALGLNVKDGDYLIEVAGMPAKSGSDFMGALINRANQVIAVKVNDKPTAEGARTIRIKPMGDDGRLRYYDWVAKNREYVDKATDGKIGYIHVPDQGEFGMQEFIKQYYPQRSKDALIVDQRFNGGGYIQSLIINTLSSRLNANFNSRWNETHPWTRQGDYFPGPMCCVINEFDASCGEEFPFHFKTAGLGPLVGRRTWGGEVGSDPGWALADGGKIHVPGYGAFTPKDGWIIESRGTEPDYDVESDPNLWVQGKDPQLDKAIELMQAAVKKNPTVHPVQPPDPVRVVPRG